MTHAEAAGVKGFLIKPVSPSSLLGAMLEAKPGAFDGVLMEIQMPVMDDYAAARAIRNDVRFRELLVIAMTADAMAGDRDKALDAGMNDHIAKPIDVDELFSVLKLWLKPPDLGREPDKGKRPI